MIKRTVILFLLSLSCFSVAQTQVPLKTGVEILKAEDARRYDAVLKKLMADSNAAVRKRAALAAGRIGTENAVGPLADLLQNDKEEDVRAMAAFAIGEIESPKGADAILKALNDPQISDSVRARAVEAAGKIAAADPKDGKAKELGDAIVTCLRAEKRKNEKRDRETVLLALTAALRTRPDKADDAAARFLDDADALVRADAANTLARFHAKNANPMLRALLAADPDPVVRANAARALGAAEDADSLTILGEALTKNVDSRVRVSAIRSLGSLKEERAANYLLNPTYALFDQLKKSSGNSAVKNELLEIATALGRLLPDTTTEVPVNFIIKVRAAMKFESPEVEIAFARMAPKLYVDSFQESNDWKSLSAQYQGLAELASLDASREPDAKQKARLILIQEIALRFTPGPHSDATVRSRPDLVRSLAAFKSENISNILRLLLDSEPDVFVRAAIAETLGEQPPGKENIEELKKAFDKAIDDKEYDDAQLAILDALYKLDEKEAVGTLVVALGAPDYLVRKKAFEMLDDKDLQKDFPVIATSLESAKAKHKDQVLPYSPAFGTKLGQVLNTEGDYRRALSRKNGSARAVITTAKGTFTIDLLPQDAPLTVNNFIKLANSRYFNGVEVHRVVPNFVMQDGDPRGDGNGGPGWSIRCEINMVSYERGSVGMALSGKDTGGSQWFVTHSPQPHLDGGYTVFGKVNESGMKVVDNIVRGDKIVRVTIVEKRGPQKRPGK